MNLRPRTALGVVGCALAVATFALLVAGPASFVGDGDSGSVMADAAGDAGRRAASSRPFTWSRSAKAMCSRSTLASCSFCAGCTARALSPPLRSRRPPDERLPKGRARYALGPSPM